MDVSTVYPAGPAQVPDNLTRPNASYKRHVWLAMLGLTFFMLAYFALLGCFAWITWASASALHEGRDDVIRSIVILPCAAILTLFMAKSLFAVKRAGNTDGMEVTEQEQPALFSLIYRLADEIGAPRPHRVFLTPDVNAAVSYDLSLLNLFFPSKKNLIIGLGLVNVLSLGEMKAVLAHEFGHFAQRSMMVGRWVYIAHQIIGHMVATRDWLDKLVKFIGSIDLRIAWFGWLLSIVIWSIRAVVDTLFSLVVMAERALSREMEFNADLVAVSVTGSDALVNALHKLQAADHAWQTALNVAERESRNGQRIADLFSAQRVAMEAMRHVLDDQSYGATPLAPTDTNPAEHRVFSAQSARPPQMWATHPANRDREDNAKRIYVAAPIEARSAWTLFNEPAQVRSSISQSFYNAEKRDEMEVIAAKDAVMKRFAFASLAPKYLGNYLGRAPLRNFSSMDELLSCGEIAATPQASIAQLYPSSLKDLLKQERDLDIEIATLEGLRSGHLKPSGGVIRHRGEELKKEQIPTAISELKAERSTLAEQLKQHDASCRRAYLQAAEQLDQGWHSYLLSLNKLLHCTSHLAAVAHNEQALLTNTWLVITADKQIGFFEKRRMIRVAKQVEAVLREVASTLQTLRPTASTLEKLGIDRWKEQIPQFNLLNVSEKNWADWCPAASQEISSIAGLLDYISDVTLEEIIEAEQTLHHVIIDADVLLTDAPASASTPEDYLTLLPGNEHVLQQKLDLWNRFQLAQGLLPTLSRLLIAGGIVGGTILFGLLYKP